MLTYQQKKLSITCASVLVILGLVYGTVYVLCRTYLTSHNIQELIISQAEQTLKRDVSISKNIGFSIDWDMSPHIILHDVTIANSPWSSHPIMLKATAVDVHFSLTKLLFKDFHIISLELDEPELYLESHNGENNWDFDNKNSDASNSTIKLSINRINVSHGILHHNNDTFKLDKFDLTIPDGDTLYHIHVLGKRNNLPLKATINIQKTVEKIKVDVEHLLVGSSTITGEININKSPLKVTGELTANTFAIDDFSSNSTSNSGEYSISNTPLKIKQLKDSVFDINISIDKFVLKNITLKHVGIQAQNIKNILNIQLKPAVNVASGKLNANLAFDLNYDTPQIQFRAKTSGIQFESLMKEMFDTSPVSGSALEISANLDGAGNDLNSIVSSLSGRILATAGPGTLTNSTAALSNVFTMVLTSVITFDKTKPSTAFTCGVLNFKVNNGVATANNGIGIEAASANVLGNGMVDLRNGRIKFTITPQNLLSTNPANIANFSMAQLVQVNGTLSKPQVSLNPAGLLTPSNGLMVAKMAGLGAGGLPGLAVMLAEQTINKPAAQVSPCKAALAAN